MGVLQGAVEDAAKIANVYTVIFSTTESGTDFEIALISGNQPERRIIAAQLFAAAKKLLEGG